MIDKELDNIISKELVSKKIYGNMKPRGRLINCVYEILWKYGLFMNTNCRNFGRDADR
jgi:hypothetical protein